jgi:hypothetical protein
VPNPQGEQAAAFDDAEKRPAVQEAHADKEEE